MVNVKVSIVKDIEQVISLLSQRYHELSKFLTIIKHILLEFVFESK